MANQRPKILLVFGTRPAAIKMAPLVLEFLRRKEEFDTTVCVTAQHREMLDQVLDIFSIVPDYDLNIMKPGQDLYDVTSSVLLGMRDVLDSVKPDLVFVHGDTATSVTTALASFFKQIKVAHVEAGLRTYDIYSPWPEELNRQVTGKIANLHFSPTSMSRDNLLNEGVFSDKIFVTGNTVIDALFLIIHQLENNPKLREQQQQILIESGLPSEIVDQLETSNKNKLVLITGHRRENFGGGFDEICKALYFLSEKYPYIHFIYPMHLNPNVRKPIDKMFGDKEIKNLFFIEPLEYLSFVYLMSKAYILLTDSGGIQEEAPALGKPVLVMRNTTERPEAVEAGTVKLVGTDSQKIVSEVSRLVEDQEAYNEMSSARNPYGIGDSSIQIADIVRNVLVPINSQ